MEHPTHRHLGCNGWTEVELFECQKWTWLEPFLGLPRGIPSHNIFGRVFARLDPLGSVAGHHPRTAGGAHGRQDDSEFAQRRADGAAPALVSAWVQKAYLVLGQRRVDSKSNGILAIPELLKSLVLDGCVMTVDALAGQTRIAQSIRDRSVDYILALKGHHPHLHEALVETFVLNR